MEYTNLGKSSLKTSKVILGAMSYDSSDWQKWVLDKAESLPLLKYAFDIGLNTWDVADVYCHGRSKEIIGKALRKYKFPSSGDGNHTSITSLSSNDEDFVNGMGLSGKHIFDVVDASVARLGTYIDVLQIPRLEFETPGEET